MEVPVEAYDAVVLAGGRARRLGGVSKPDVAVGGRRLLDRTLEATVGAREVVVVGPAEVAPPGVRVTREDPPGGGPVAGLAAGLAALPDGAAWVLVLACDLPRVAGAVGDLLTAARDGEDVQRDGEDAFPDGKNALPDGRNALPDGEGAFRDGKSALPNGKNALPDGEDAFHDGENALPDGAVLVDAEGHRQPLAAVYRRLALEAALGRLAERTGGLSGVSMRALLAPLHLLDVPDPAGLAVDVDTWADVERWVDVERWAEG